MKAGWLTDPHGATVWPLRLHVKDIKCCHTSKPQEAMNWSSPWLSQHLHPMGKGILDSRRDFWAVAEHGKFYLVCSPSQLDSSPSATPLHSLWWTAAGVRSLLSQRQRGSTFEQFRLLESSEPHSVSWELLPVVGSKHVWSCVYKQELCLCQSYRWLHLSEIQI